MSKNREKAINNFNLCYKFIKTKKRLPLISSKNNEEKRLAGWMNRQKAAKRGQGSSVLYFAIENAFMYSEFDLLRKWLIAPRTKEDDLLGEAYQEWLEKNQEIDDNEEQYE